MSPTNWREHSLSGYLEYQHTENYVIRNEKTIPLINEVILLNQEIFPTILIFKKTRKEKSIFFLFVLKNVISNYFILNNITDYHSS